MNILKNLLKFDKFLNKAKDRFSEFKVSKDDFDRKKKLLINNEVFVYENINDIIIDNIVFDGKYEDNPIELIVLK